MNITLQSLQESITQAIDMIDQSQLLSDDLLHQRAIKHSMNSLDFTNANSLLDKCEQVTNSYKKTKPVIRIIHHFACSGGTLISKCLAAMPNVFLLSEVHPTTELHQQNPNPIFSPTDLSLQSFYANVPDMKNVARKIFTAGIKEIYEHLSEFGCDLILREHTHSDYCIENLCKYDSEILSCLTTEYEVLSLVTVRDPVDAYLSLVKMGWVHFSPPTFDEYCSRLFRFLSNYNTSNIVKYEDLVKNPDLEMKKICNILELKFSDDYKDIFDIFKVSGGSGRTSSNIEERERKGISSDFLKEVSSSKMYNKIKEIIDY
jgi:hypothetical protein